MMDKLQMMRIFVSVVRAHSFKAVATQLDTSTPNISRAVSRLEEILQTRLLNRTTRRVSLTSAGARYYEHCEQILAEIHDAECEAARAHTRPIGNLKVHAMSCLGSHYVIKAIAAYQRTFPEVSFDVTITDKIPDMIGEHYDVSVMIADKLADSNFFSQCIGSTYSILCASPEYLRRHGTPSSPSALHLHHCLKLVSPMAPSEKWALQGPDGEETLVINSSFFNVNTSDAMTTAIVNGMGIGVQPVYAAIEGLAQGTLVRVLPDYRMKSLSFFALYPSRKFVDAKTKTWIDFLRDALPPLIAAEEATMVDSQAVCANLAQPQIVSAALRSPG